MCINCKNSSNNLKYEELGIYIKDLISDKSDIEQRRSALLPSLYQAQKVFGFLPAEVQEFVAEKLDIHLSEIYGVVSFYSYFTMVPQGKYRISVCTGTACHIKGADKILKRFSEALGIDDGEVTKGLTHSLDTLRCVGACGLAPVVLVNDKVYGNVTLDMIPMILRECEEV
jgi:NADH:ubiquinone oxidoreductase subunit E